MENLPSLTPDKSKRYLSALKFVFGMLLLPVVYSFTISFLSQAQLIQANILTSFIAGIVTFLIFYLFIYEPVKFYHKGQKTTDTIVRFFSPLFRIAPFVIPIYSIIIFLIYFSASFFIKSDSFAQLFLFLIGFTFIMHLVFSSKSLRVRKNDFLMANYIFSFSLIYIINITLLALGFSILFKGFSWFAFCQYSFQITKDFFYSTFSQLFINASS